MKKWKCDVCGFVYNEERGYKRDGISANTLFEDIDDEWICPACQVGKEEFYVID